MNPSVNLSLHEFTRLRAFSSLTRIEREKPALSFLYI